MPPYKIYSAGDSALTLEFGDRIAEAVNDLVLKSFFVLKYKSADMFIDVVPAYSSITVFYDVVKWNNKESTAYDKVIREVETLLASATFEENAPGKVVEIPVCYEEKFAPDISTIAATKNFSIEEVIRIHTERTYRVYMIGFLPGFPYLGEVDEQIAVPRRQQPRRIVPAGAVGIAGRQTGIYSIDSPGGWQIIGRTPLKIFHPDEEDPVLLQPGDKVIFYPITSNEFDSRQGGHF